MLSDVAIELEDSTLKSPFAGRVVQRMLDEGAMASSLAPVLRIIEDSLEVRIGIPLKMAAGLKVESVAEILINGTTHQATVHSKLAEVDLTTRTQLVVFRLNEGSWGYRNRCAYQCPLPGSPLNGPARLLVTQPP